jgi:hypothetical protein
MATTEELLFSKGKFKFRKKVYTFLGYCPILCITMVSKDGKRISFGEDSPISKKFVLIKSQQLLNFRM